VLDPVIIDIGHQLHLFAELIQRTLGDTVEMRLTIGAELWHTKVDLGQLENAILNLVINSRDAMPNGGRLTVAAHNFKPDATFFRTHTGPDGLGPDQTSYGFAFRPNDQGTPFGNAHYQHHHLFGGWYAFAASNDW
jgi:hypothetical protein